MSCLLRLPDQNSKGVVTFTTQERTYLEKNPQYQKLFNHLKSRFYVGLHFNWHDFNYNPKLSFDFLMAGDSDLVDSSGNSIKTLNLDACNFSPNCMRVPGESFEKHWDILYIARGVFFKGIEHFFESVRSLYDQGNQLRVLFLCPVPPRVEEQTEELLAQYKKTFNPDEQKLFNFLLIRENYPFFFDLETLAHFYRSSKVFVHSADDERRCRVAAYAFCSGLPVVGKASVGSILSAEARKSVFFEAAEYRDFPQKILEALSAKVSLNDVEKARQELSEEYTVEALKQKIAIETDAPSGFTQGRWFTEHLDLRLGSHHGLGMGPNFISVDLAEWMNLLMGPSLESKVLGVESGSAIEKAIVTEDSNKLNIFPLSYRLKTFLKRYLKKALLWRN